MQALAMAAALSRTLVRVLGELDEPSIGDDDRAAVADLAARLEAAIEARAADG
jgi:hypothetical protein